MQRRVLLWILVVLLGIGAAAFWPWRDGSTPLLPEVPAMPLRPPAAEPVRGGPLEPIGPPRIATGTARQPAPTGESTAVVEVTLVSGAMAPPGGGAAPADEPVPDVDVRLVVDAEDGANDGAPDEANVLQARTDRRGRTRFLVPGGDGLEAALHSGLGGEFRGTLSARVPQQWTLRILPRILVTGSVVDARGQGVANAELVLVPWLDATSRTAQTWLVGRSGADGSFRVALARGGQFGAQHADFSPSRMHAVHDLDRSKPPTTATLRLSLLTLQARAQGIVLAADGSPVAGAEVEFRSRDDSAQTEALAAAPQRVESRKDGGFQVANLRPGRIDYAARAAGQGACRGSFEAGAGQTVALTIRMAPAGEVHGIVETADGLAVEGAVVRAGAEDAFDSVVERTGADGTFRLRGLPPGPADLVARAPAANAGEPPSRVSKQVEIVPNAVAYWRAVLDTGQTGPRLRGQVVDAAGSPLPAWRVRMPALRGSRVAETDPKGEFTMALGKQQLVDLFVYAPKQPLSGFAAAVRRGVDPSQPAVLVVDRELRTGTLTGGVQDEDQAPLPATIGCWHEERREYVRLQAGADGRFRIEGVPTGTLDLEFSHPGHCMVRRLGLQVGAGVESALGTIVLTHAAAVSGTVIGPDGRPPAQLDISVVAEDQRLFGEYTDGVYRIGGVPAGRHRLQVQGPSVAAASFEIRLEAGVETEQPIKLNAGVPRRIVVAAPPAAGAFVSLALRRPGETHLWLSGSNPGEARSCEFLAFMAPGVYEAVAWGSNGFEATATIPFVVEGDAEPVRLELQRR